MCSLCPRPPTEIALQSFSLLLKKKEEKKGKRRTTGFQRSDDETRSGLGNAIRAIKTFELRDTSFCSGFFRNVNDLPDRQIFRGKSDGR